MALTRYVGLGRQSAHVTAVSATKYVESVCKLIPDQGWMIPDPICDPSRVNYNVGPFRTRGNMGPFDVKANNIGEIINAIMGNEEYTVATSGNTATPHKWKCSADLDSYTVRIGAEHEERILAGMLANRLTLKASHGENLQGTVEWVGPSVAETTGSLASLTRANLSTLQPFHYCQTSGNADIAGGDRSAVLFDFELNILNNIPIERGNFNSRFFSTMRRGSRLVTGKFSAYFDDDDEYDRFLAGSSIAIDVTFVGQTVATWTNYTLRLYMPVCVYLRDCAHPVQRMDEPLVIDCPFQALYDSTNTELYVELADGLTTAFT